jgi:predicted nucleotidyltransferase component of viral defense system
MAKTYSSAAAFRQALETRLRVVAEQRGVQIDGLRLKVAIERLLARLFLSPSPPWLLKGGYSMELRFRPKARTTRDVDLSVGDSVEPVKLKQRLAEVHESLQIAAEQRLDDFFEFLIEPARSEIQAAPGGGGVFAVIAKMDGRDFARFHVDVGFGDSVIGVVECLEGDNLLDFAGIVPARAMAIPREQQFAEKVHAYSFPWIGRENMRSRDLVDLVVLIERGGLDVAAVRHALRETFRRRKRHPLPQRLAAPPRIVVGRVPEYGHRSGCFGC